jgi:hypothetical protein
MVSVYEGILRVQGGFVIENTKKIYGVVSGKLRTKKPETDFLLKNTARDSTKSKGG